MLYTIINGAAVNLCDLSPSNPVVPVKVVVPVRIDSYVADLPHSRQAGKSHLGLALCFGRDTRPHPMASEVYSCHSCCSTLHA